MTTAQSYANIEDKTHALNVVQKLQRFALKACCSAMPPLGLKVALYHFTNVRRRRPYSLRAFPGQVKSMTLNYRKGHIVTYSWGQGDKVIYLVHGWESNSSCMAGFIKPLIQKGYKVVAFDMPAHGRSSKQATHLRDFATTLELVISHYGKPFGILAHSFGGNAVVLLMHERQHLLPKKLCLISPMQSLQNHLQVFNTITGLSEKMMDKLLMKLKINYALETKHTDISTLMKGLPIPGLLIHDAYDRLIPVEVSDNLADIWCNAQYLRTQQLGHRKILKDAFVIQSVTDYMLDRS